MLPEDLEAGSPIGSRWPVQVFARTTMPPRL